jgi:RNA-directed DNA polymerase
MTTPRYPQGCPAGSQVHREASSSPDASDPDYAWIVNFNNGNVNLNNRNNNAFVRAVRSVPASQSQGAHAESVPLRALYIAWQKARRKKRPSHDQVRFESQWIDGLLDLQRRLDAGTWLPSPSTCFVATRPKAREIHAPAFADRVVHHWIVPQLEAIIDPSFIADSYSNRKGKGTLAAVKRLQTFVRQVHSGQGGGYYLQLDIRNFFNAIHRPTLYRMLKRRIESMLPIAGQRVVHALLRDGVKVTGVRHRSSANERDSVPAHKRLENADAGCGIPIGNLSSQFFANVYLDALDQFVKHILKAKRYLRYVDDFVLVHHDRAQLLQWQHQIEQFLRDRLRLTLKADIRLRPLTDGIDFLGYVVRPTHTTVRRRVVAHANNTIAAWARQHIACQHINAKPAELRAITSTWRSYEGHLRHASTHRLREALHRRHPWLHSATLNRTFHHRAEHRQIAIAWAHH